VTATPTATGIATVTRTATPAGSLTLAGRVYDAADGSSISAATVTLLTCVPRTFSTQSTSDGTYSLFIPAADVSACGPVTWTVTAAGYEHWTLGLTMELLRSNPQRDIGLTALPLPTPPPDLTLTGLVYDALAGRGQPIAGAVVGVEVCVLRTFSTHTWSDGSYNLLIPGGYLESCPQVRLQAAANGYQEWSRLLDVSDLRANPVRDLGLDPLATPTAILRRAYLPVITRQ